MQLGALSPFVSHYSVIWKNPVMPLVAATAVGFVGCLFRAHIGSETLRKAKHLLLSVLPWSGLLIAVNPGFAQTWTLTSAPFTNWTSVASSADGSHLVASAYGGPSKSGSVPGAIFISTNSGASWAMSSSGTYWLNWVSVASSADGTKLFAAGVPAGDVHFPIPLNVSTNGGAGWRDTEGCAGIWQSVATSGDGSKIFAAGPPFFISMDSGASWTQPSLGYLLCGAWSADGQTLAVGSTVIAASTNAGVTWVFTDLTNGYCRSVAASADGTKLAAATSASQSADGGRIYRSADSGASWTALGAPYANWTSVASSADGTKLVATAYWANGGPIYRSTDSGATWTTNGSPYGNSPAVASSADGCKLIAVYGGCCGSGGIYTWQTTPKPVLNVTPSGSNLLLSWTVPSTPFALEESADLTGTNWTEVANAPILNPTNLQHQLRLPLPAANRFYRLRASVN
jgi:hypothetical protein